MSKNIYGNTNFNIQNLNKKVDLQEVSVDIDSYLNRKTEASTIRKYIACAGGFHRGLWQPPLVARLPDGTLNLFDGDHRRALWKKAYPEKKTMPAQIINVENLKEISKYFVIINKTGRKALTAEENFVHEVLSGDPEAVKTSKNLERAGLSVSLGTGKPGSVVGATVGFYTPSAWNVKIGGFKRTVKECGLLSVSLASQTIQETWSENIIRNELLGGMAKIFKNTNIGSNKDILKIFKKYLKSMADTTGSQRDVANDFKIEGGNYSNMAQDSIALGIIEKFRKSPMNTMSKATFYRHFGAYKGELKKKLT